MCVGWRRCCVAIGSKIEPGPLSLAFRCARYRRGKISGYQLKLSPEGVLSVSSTFALHGTSWRVISVHLKHGGTTNTAVVCKGFGERATETTQHQQRPHNLLSLFSTNRLFPSDQAMTLAASGDEIAQEAAAECFCSAASFDGGRALLGPVVESGVIFALMESKSQAARSAAARQAR